VVSGTTFPVARVLIFCGAVVMALGVVMGAVSVHAAKVAAHPDAAHLSQAAVIYQLVHGLGLVAAGTLARLAPSRLLAAAGALFLVGVVAFCGSLYLLAFSGVSLGLVIPAGGIAFIAGWLALAAYAIRAK
jgi:uncharacterized membrane protein YgdD (TMEM256/DUF423 family)